MEEKSQHDPEQHFFRSVNSTMKQPNFDKRADQSLKNKKYKHIMPMTNFEWNVPMQQDGPPLVDNYGPVMGGMASSAPQTSTGSIERVQNYKRAVETLKQFTESHNLMQPIDQEAEQSMPMG